MKVFRASAQRLTVWLAYLCSLPGKGIRARTGVLTGLILQNLLALCRLPTPNLPIAGAAAVCIVNLWIYARRLRVRHSLG